MRGRLIVLSRAGRDHRPGLRRARGTPAHARLGQHRDPARRRACGLAPRPARPLVHRRPRWRPERASAPDRDQQHARARPRRAVYPAAASLRRGTFAFAPGHSRNELSGWTSVSQRRVAPAAGDEALRDGDDQRARASASSGERYAVIWAEVSAPAPAAGGVTLVNRVGDPDVRLGRARRRTSGRTSRSARSSRSARRPGSRSSIATIRNSGQRTLDISGTLTLSNGPGGLRAGPFPVKLGAPSRPATRSRRPCGWTNDSPAAPGKPTSSSEAGSSTEQP